MVELEAFTLPLLPYNPRKIPQSSRCGYEHPVHSTSPHFSHHSISASPTTITLLHRHPAVRILTSALSCLHPRALPVLWPPSQAFCKPKGAHNPQHTAGGLRHRSPRPHGRSLPRQIDLVQGVVWMLLRPSDFTVSCSHNKIGCICISAAFQQGFPSCHLVDKGNIFSFLNFIADEEATVKIHLQRGVWLLVA